MQNVTGIIRGNPWKFPRISTANVLAGVYQYERAVAASGGTDQVEMPNNRKRKKKSGSRSREARDLKRSVWRADGRSAASGDPVYIPARQRRRAFQRVVTVVGRQFAVEGTEWWAQAEVETLRLSNIMEMMCVRSPFSVPHVCHANLVHGCA